MAMGFQHARLGAVVLRSVTVSAGQLLHFQMSLSFPTAAGKQSWVSAVSCLCLRLSQRM